jgi:hypothetical protein
MLNPDVIGGRVNSISQNTGECRRSDKWSFSKLKKL